MTRKTEPDIHPSFPQKVFGMNQPNPVAQQNPNSRRTVLLATDLKTSVLAQIDGTNPSFIVYSPYGWPSPQAGLMTRVGFNGELREVHTEWYLLGKGYRAYNPRLMRFHSPDSLSPFEMDQWNAYAYCGGEPVMSSDPSGHFSLGWIWPGAQRVIAGARTLTSRTASIVATATSQTAGNVSSGISKISGIFHRTRRTIVEALSFDEMRAAMPSPSRNSRAAALNRATVSSGAGDTPNQTHGYANRVELPSRKPAGQTHGFSTRTELRSNKPKDQLHPYTYRRELPSTDPTDQPHRYANRKMVPDNHSRSTTSAIRKSL